MPLAAMERALSLAQAIHERQAENRLHHLYRDTYENGHRFLRRDGTLDESGPYAWQVEFHNAGARYHERMMMAANRVGKTRTVGAEVAVHATGLYPPWWEGYRFNEPIRAICAGISNELVRDTVQLQLIGRLREGERVPSGTGWIPASLITGFDFRVSGVKGCLESLSVRHASGGTSLLQFKSYEQDSEKFQGTSQHLIWLDEEPRDYGLYTECLTRTADTDGMILFSRTPLFGLSEYVLHFQSSDHCYIQHAGWDDAPHLTEEVKARMLESLPPHERVTRSKGLPMMGTGAVYPVLDEELLVPPCPIPRHWRQIAGLDFGIDHPAAVLWLAYDADRDVVYVVDAVRVANQTTAYVAEGIKARGTWIPVAWPHDGMKRDPNSGKALADQYREHGVNMLHRSARMDEEKGGAQSREAPTLAILERMKTGRWKVFDVPQLRDYLTELHMLHRVMKGNPPIPQIHAVRDDLESAGRYAFMDLNFAQARHRADMIEAQANGAAAAASTWDPFDPSTMSM